MATYQLNGYTLSDKSGGSLGTHEFDDKMLLSNVHWFISVRWIVIAVFIISGVTGIVFSDIFLVWVLFFRYYHCFIWPVF